jgi:hypothetical protein
MASVGGARVRRFIMTGALASALVAGGTGVAMAGTQQHALVHDARYGGDAPPGQEQHDWLTGERPPPGYAAAYRGRLGGGGRTGQHAVSARCHVLDRRGR